jgi:hypothetical protein
MYESVYLTGVSPTAPVMLLAGFLLRPHVVVQGWLHCILYVLFENAMGVVKLWAVIAGQTSSLCPALGLTEDCSVIALELPEWHGRITPFSQNNPTGTLRWLPGCRS